MQGVSDASNEESITDVEKPEPALAMLSGGVYLLISDHPQTSSAAKPKSNQQAIATTAGGCPPVSSSSGKTSESQRRNVDYRWAFNQ